MAIAYDGKLTCSLRVSDLDRSIAWYKTVLGFEVDYRMDQMGWCELHTSVPGVTIGLGQSASINPDGGTTPTFGVTDIDAAKAALDAADVKQDGGVRDIPGMVRLLTFYDPDGNTLMFFQVPAAS